MQVFYDAANGQYFIPVQQGSDDGISQALLPVNVEGATTNENDPRSK